MKVKQTNKADYNHMAKFELIGTKKDIVNKIKEFEQRNLRFRDIYTIRENDKFKALFKGNVFDFNEE